MKLIKTKSKVKKLQTMKKTKLTLVAILAMLFFLQSCTSDLKEGETESIETSADEAHEEEETTTVVQTNSTEQKSNTKAVETFTGYFKNKDISAIAKNIYFPLKRAYPIPSIENEEEFLERYNEVFDARTFQAIANSNEKDWISSTYISREHGEEVTTYSFNSNGSGVQIYDNGIVHLIWMSKAEQKLKAAITKAEKETLHPSLRNFETPVTIIETSKFKIRIDDLGDNNYRYASWEIHQEMSEKPDLVIENGYAHYSGTCGNHVYQFKNGKYIYQCAINVCGTNETPPADLTLYKSDNADVEKDPYDYEEKDKILFQKAEIVDMKKYYRTFYGKVVK